MRPGNFLRRLPVMLAAIALATGGARADAPASSASASSAPGSNAGFNSGRGVAHPDLWPAYHYPVVTDAETEARIDDLMRRMTLEEKIGQLLQGDISRTTPADVRRYHLGSIEAGGNSGPGGDDFAPASAWLKLADQFWAASTDRRQGAGIPVIWGIDAVHGHSNIIGATLFPHNVGLGAAHDPALIEQIGAVTATELSVTGQEWTFAPTVAVPQDYRWGRAYEGYSSDPHLVAAYVGAMVRGLQGPPEQGNLLAHGKVLASTKHFLGDGGTKNGTDQGDDDISEAELRDIHGVPYGPAIENGVATVMVSFSSWQGRKMTGNQSLITGVLKQRMGFGGFVVSDWNAHGQVEGCTNSDCPQALLAGIDMYMAVGNWKDLYHHLLAEVRSGRVPMARVDDAVRRILAVKFRLGLFAAGKPSDRPLAGHWDLLGAPAHRAVARQAVQESLVLLKNDGVLPLKPGGRLLVAGDGADDLTRQAGGWTISWQGSGLPRKDFPGATSVWEGLRQAVTSAGGHADLSPDGSFTQRPDAAVVVFGEKPYAEFQGDRTSLQLAADLRTPWATMARLKAQGIPVVAVMLTGRPLFVNPALNVADAFVVAWLPGSEGEGVADVLVTDAAGHAHDFRGTLPMNWPRTARATDGILFPINYGLTYHSAPQTWVALPEDPGVADSGSEGDWFTHGVAAAGWSLNVESTDGRDATRITSVPAAALAGRVAVSAVDSTVQEGARRFVLSQGSATIALAPAAPLDLTRQTNGDVQLVFTARADQAGGALRLAMGTVELPITLSGGNAWKRYGIALKCFAARGVNMASVDRPFALKLTGPADIAIGDVLLGDDPEVTLPCPHS